MPKPILTTTAVLLALIGNLSAADKAPSPNQILGGKAAISSSGSANFYSGNGSYAGRISTNGRTTAEFNGQGGYAGRIDRSNGSANIYDGKASYAGRASASGNGTSFYDSKGSYSGRSSMSGNMTQFYDGHGAYEGRATKSGNTTNFYDSHGAYSGRSTYSGNSMGSDRRPYSGQAAASAGGVMRHYDARGRNVGSTAR